MSLRPAMLPSEIAMLSSFLACADNYVEFGAGGSTVLAASLVKSSVTSIDSSQDWLDKVSIECQTGYPVLPKTFLVDIGPIGSFGYPKDKSFQDRWPDYHNSIWSEPDIDQADLFLVDGRFRVACFLQTLLRCREGAIILIHDFMNRPMYHVIMQFAREIARADNLSAFQRNADFDAAAARSCLATYNMDAR